MERPSERLPRHSGHQSWLAEQNCWREFEQPLKPTFAVSLQSGVPTYVHLAGGCIKIGRVYDLEAGLSHAGDPLVAQGTVGSSDGADVSNAGGSAADGAPLIAGKKKAPNFICGILIKTGITKIEVTITDYPRFLSAMAQSPPTTEGSLGAPVSYTHLTLPTIYSV